MNVKVKYYGLLKDITGIGQEVLKLNKTESIEDIVQEKLINKYPSIKNIDFRIAVNDEFCDLKHTLKENDELSFLPLFSGG